MEPVMSAEVTTHTSSDGSFAPAPVNSGQGLFPSLLKGEPSVKIHSGGVFLTPHDTGNKEKISLFGKASTFSFSNTASNLTSEVTPFQVKNISIGLSTPPSTTTVASVPFVRPSSPQASLKNITGLAPDSTVSPFTSSLVFSLPKENVGSSSLASKVPIAKTETSFSFAEAFKKETTDKNSFAEPQPERQGTSIFGKPPAFSFSSAAANIMSDKVSNQSSSVGVGFQGSSGNVPPVSEDHEQHSSKGEHKSESETLIRKPSVKISSKTTSSSRKITGKVFSQMTSSKTSPRVADSRAFLEAMFNRSSSSGKTSSKSLDDTTSIASSQMTSSKTSPRVTAGRAFLEAIFNRSSSSGKTSSKSSDDTTSKASSGSNAIKLHRDSPGSSSASRHMVKDHGNSVVKRIKHKKEVSSTAKLRKKSKDDESKADSISSGLLTAEEIPKLASIVCKGIHPDLNHRSDLIKHFSKFGQIKKVTCSTRHSHAVVTFATHEAAKKAKALGSIISPNCKPVEIFWHANMSKSNDEKKPLFQSEVHEELESMMEIDSHHILDRPTEHQPAKSPKISTSPRKRNEMSKSDLKDNKHSEIAKSSKTSDSSEDSLKQLLEVQALTEKEKYRVLNARDKLMRLSLQKQSDISKAKAVVGTCPDICSEKERYSRFDKKCLSVYEQKRTFDPSITVKCLDHRIIVKEYCRSSADKEEPLPHEIRPTHVLSMAMNHLMCNVANRVTDSSLSVGEWFDFIWNRTRAIRKDITQQDLCSIESVKLVEKCVRFHIHCAATLCEEDMAVFDPKINDENLMKSLQTLKHMYHDLALNNIKCSNEAEFRAYDILLSLNEGDTLRHAQNFSSEIRGSPEVRFAVSAAFAMNSNNYSRFFKLAEEASYLNACIMHRYFTPVRVRALRVMLKAYCLPNHVEMYPLEELVKVLKFESVAEASQFCQWLGFQTDENHILLDRMSSVTPSSSAFVTRSINLVEKKRSVSVGEVMNKGPLPVNPLVLYEPHCSFDCDGYLRKEAYDASDQKLKTQEGNTTVTITIIQPEPISEENEVVPVTELISEENEVVPVTEPVSEENEVVPVTEPMSEENEVVPVIMTCGTSVDSSPKSSSPSSHYLATDTDQLHSSPISKAAVVTRASDNKSLSVGSPLSTANEQKSSICSSEQVFQSFQNVVQKKVLRPVGLNTVEVMQYVSDIWKQLSSEIIQNCVREVATCEYVTEIACTRLRDSLICEVVKDSCFQIARDVIRDVMKEKMAACEVERQKAECANSLTEEIILETVQEHISSFVEHEYQEVRAQILDATCKSLMTAILESCISHLVTSVAEEVHSQEKNDWQNLVQAAKRKTQLLQAKKALAKWRRAYMKRRKLEICRDTFPCSPQIPLKGNSAVSDCESVLSKVKKKEQLSKLLDAGVLLSSIKHEFSWLPLDLAGLFEKHFPNLEAADSPNPKKMCWKLLLLVPEHCGGDDDDSWTPFIHWFCAKFCREKLKNSFEDGTVLCDLFETKSHGYHADICVRAVLLGSKDFLQNLEIMKKKRLLEGTSAVFLVMPYYKMNDLIHEEILSQVQQIFHIKRPVPSVPLYCFLVGSKVFQIPQTVTQVLNSLEKKLFLCNYKISGVEDTAQYWKSSEELLEATTWLLEQYQVVPALTSCSLKNMVEDCLPKIFGIIYEDLSHVTSPKKAQNPSKMIIFYNSVIRDYTEAVCSSALSNISWPSPEVITCAHISEAEVGWNEPENFDKIRTTLANMHLPEFHGSPVSLDDLWVYVREVANVGGSDRCNFFSSIKTFLFKNEEFVANNSCIPWCDVVYDCAHYLMSCQSFINESTKKELQVTYIYESINCIDLKLKWAQVPQGNEVVINYQNVFMKKRKHFSERMHESSQRGDAYLSDILEHSPVKCARNENSDKEQGITFEQHSTLGRMQRSQTTYQPHSDLSASNQSMSDTKRESFLLMEALAAEKCQSESYLALLEAKVAEGQCINEDILGDTFLEDYDNGIEASSRSCSRRLDYDFEDELPVLCTSTNLNKSLEELKDKLTSQQKANESYERRLREFM